jgi:hypothetical protein
MEPDDLSVPRVSGVYPRISTIPPGPRRARLSTFHQRAAEYATRVLAHATGCVSCSSIRHRAGRLRWYAERSAPRSMIDVFASQLSDDVAQRCQEPLPWVEVA